MKIIWKPRRGGMIIKKLYLFNQTKNPEEWHDYSKDIQHEPEYKSRRDDIVIERA